MSAFVMLFRAAGSAEFRWRYPELWAEVRRRRAAEARFANMSRTESAYIRVRTQLHHAKPMLVNATVATELAAWNSRFSDPVRAAAAELTGSEGLLAPSITTQNPPQAHLTDALPVLMHGSGIARGSERLQSSSKRPQQTLHTLGHAVVRSLAAGTGKQPWRAVGGVVRNHDQKIRGQSVQTGDIAAPDAHARRGAAASVTKKAHANYMAVR